MVNVIKNTLITIFFFRGVIRHLVGAALLSVKTFITFVFGKQIANTAQTAAFALQLAFFIVVGGIAVEAKDASAAQSTQITKNVTYDILTFDEYQEELRQESAKNAQKAQKQTLSMPTQSITKKAPPIAKSVQLNIDPNSRYIPIGTYVVDVGPRNSSSLYDTKLMTSGSDIDLYLHESENKSGQYDRPKFEVGFYAFGGAMHNGEIALGINGTDTTSSSQVLQQNLSQQIISAGGSADMTVAITKQSFFIMNLGYSHAVMGKTSVWDNETGVSASSTSIDGQHLVGSAGFGLDFFTSATGKYKASVVAGIATEFDDTFGMLPSKFQVGPIATDSKMLQLGPFVSTMFTQYVGKSSRFIETLGVSFMPSYNYGGNAISSIGSRDNAIGLNGDLFGRVKYSLDVTKAFSVNAFTSMQMGGGISAPTQLIINSDVPDNVAEARDDLKKMIQEKTIRTSVNKLISYSQTSAEDIQSMTETMKSNVDVTIDTFSDIRGFAISELQILGVAIEDSKYIMFGSGECTSSNSFCFTSPATASDPVFTANPGIIGAMYEYVRQTGHVVYQNAIRTYIKNVYETLLPNSISTIYSISVGPQTELLDGVMLHAIYTQIQNIEHLSIKDNQNLPSGSNAEYKSMATQYASALTQMYLPLQYLVYSDNPAYASRATTVLAEVQKQLNIMVAASDVEGSLNSIQELGESLPSSNPSAVIGSESVQNYISYLTSIQGTLEEVISKSTNSTVVAKAQSALNYVNSQIKAINADEASSGVTYSEIQSSMKGLEPYFTNYTDVIINGKDLTGAMLYTAVQDLAEAIAPTALEFQSVMENLQSVQSQLAALEAAGVSGDQKLTDAQITPINTLLTSIISELTTLSNGSIDNENSRVEALATNMLAAVKSMQAELKTDYNSPSGVTINDIKSEYQDAKGFSFQFGNGDARDLLQEASASVQQIKEEVSNAYVANPTGKIGETAYENISSKANNALQKLTEAESTVTNPKVLSGIEAQITRINDFLNNADNGGALSANTTNQQLVEDINSVVDSTRALQVPSLADYAAMGNMANAMYQASTSTDQQMTVAEMTTIESSLVMLSMSRDSAVATNAEHVLTMALPNCGNGSCSSTETFTQMMNAAIKADKPIDSSNAQFYELITATESFFTGYITKTDNGASLPTYAYTEGMALGLIVFASETSTIIGSMTSNLQNSYTFMDFLEQFPVFDAYVNDILSFKGNFINQKDMIQSELHSMQSYIQTLQESNIANQFSERALYRAAAQVGVGFGLKV